MPKVSVIVPIYGVEKYIERCARSLFEQTLDDIEYIFVDDCTKDNSINVLERVVEDYPNRKSQVTIIHHDVNKGLPQARKTGVEASHGDYIVHCDSDDWVDTGMYQRLYEKAKKEDADVVFCDCFAYRNEKCKYVISKNINDPSKSTILKRLLTESSLNNVWSVIVKKDLFTNIVFPNDNQSEDRTIVIQLCLYAKKISSIALPLYYYRTSNMESISNQRDCNALINRYQGSCRNAEIILRILERLNLTVKYELEIQAFLFNLLSYLNRNVADTRVLQLWKKHYPDYMTGIWQNPYIGLKYKLFFYFIRAFR